MTASSAAFTSAITGSAAISSSASKATPRFDGALDNYLASLRARIGLARDDAFFYITGGLAIRDGGDANAVGLASNGGSGGKGGQNDDGQVDDPGEAGNASKYGGLGGNGGACGTPTASGFGSSKGSDTGFVVGGGVEYMLSSHVSAGVEGLWYSFDDNDATVVRARLTYHLNGVTQDSFKDSYASAEIANWSGFYVGGMSAPGSATANGPIPSRRQTGKTVRPATRAHWATHRLAAAAFPTPTASTILVALAAAAVAVRRHSSRSRTISGALAGLHLGYNWQSGARVLGVEGDADWADNRDYLASVRLRLGHAFDQVLIYGTAGVAFGQKLRWRDVRVSDIGWRGRPG